MKSVRWGIVGPGGIARKFAEAVGNVEEATLVGVASRSYERACEFAKDFGIPKAFDSYAKMAECPEIDAVYISTAHPFHAPCAEIFLKAKKHVLCEKPMCVDAESARKLCRLAKENGVFLMEAMWTACLPAIRALLNDLADGVIGTPMGMNADFCYSIEREEDPKLFEKELCGGSLLDVGVYCLHFASLVFGSPESIYALSDIRDGVDLHTQITLGYKNKAMAALSSAIKLEKPYDAHIYGTKGQIYIPSFYKADKYTVTDSEGNKAEKVFPYGENGFEFEIREACRCIRENKLESDLVPLSKTVEILEQTDRIRELIGLNFK